MTRDRTPPPESVSPAGPGRRLRPEWETGPERPSGSVHRTDVLDVGRDRPPVLERWRALPPGLRAALAALVALSVTVPAAAAAWAAAQARADRREADRAAERAAAVTDLDARLLTARARGPGGTREIRFRTANDGPLPLAVLGADLTLAGAGRLDVALRPLDIGAGATEVVRVRAVPAECPPPHGAQSAPDRLVLDVRTADGRLRPVPLELDPAVWSQLARSVGCPRA